MWPCRTTTRDSEWRWYAATEEPLEVVAPCPVAAANGVHDVELLVPADDVAQPELSIVVPALDEELTIGDFVDWCREGLDRAGIRR